MVGCWRAHFNVDNHAMENKLKTRPCIVGLVSKRAMLRKVVLRSKGKPIPCIIRSRNQLFPRRIQWRGWEITDQSSWTVPNVGRAIMWWITASLSIHVNIIFLNGNRSWRRRLAPWKRGSRFWRHPAKSWTHRLPPELRLGLLLRIIICLEIRRRWWVPQRWHVLNPCHKSCLRLQEGFVDSLRARDNSPAD